MSHGARGYAGGAILLKNRLSKENGSVAIRPCGKIRGPISMANAMAKKKTLRKTLPAGIGEVLKRLHYPLDVILLCVRWYVAYSLSLVDQDHRAIKRIIKPMMGFKDFRCARIILAGIEVMHMIRKGQMRDKRVAATTAEQFYSLEM
jgi:hypothetical protein